MGIVDTAKEVAMLVQKLDNVELLPQMLDLQAQLGDMLEERRSLREENADLRATLTARAMAEFRDNAYWKPVEGAKPEGPFCTKCFAADDKLVPMHFLQGNGHHVCPNCKTTILLPSNEHLSAPPMPRSSTWAQGF